MAGFGVSSAEASVRLFVVVIIIITIIILFLFISFIYYFDLTAFRDQLCDIIRVLLSAVSL